MISVVSNEEAMMAGASAWLARLQRDDVTGTDAADFEIWLAEAPGHRAAYERALALWHEFESSAEAVLAELDADRGSLQTRRVQTRPGLSRRWLAGAPA